ncbi:o-succinylbenzoate--CoA ligase [Paenibacillus endoradicis]|uniref:o-succinylbenzoate--CoA ligase n=1 Tax=Paenibacillus endoradicis TaxID=2972487 RepID=UPI002158EBCE|nr:o-succinylbenzoate--CoA ligase [Paenibacillus endoradicis]MCR8658501.1 o-succinylbenzoate--CoA ligase [Paenibacillus endoradicis]
MHMPHWLDKRASLTPDRIAIEYGNEQITFAQLRERSLITASKISSLPTKQGYPIALLCYNDSYTVELIHAVHYVGGILMPLNIRLTAHELLYQLQDAKCNVLIYDPQFQQLIDLIIDEYNNIRCICTTALQQMDIVTDTSLVTYIDQEETHTIMYTSGTTGFPKGVIQSYSNHWNSAVGSMLNLGLSEHDKWLVCVPLFHISGLSIVIRSVLYGIPMVIHEKFDPVTANAAIIDQGVTIMSVVSNMLSRMVEQLGDVRYPEHFRCMLLGGGPAPLSLLEQCVVKEIPVFQTYGMTETCSQIVTLQPEYMLSKLGSAGKPLFQAELKIMMDGHEAQAMEAGEIIVRGPNVTSGYLNGVGTNSFVGGWLYTGDVGYVDEDGFLYVLDRRRDMFVSGGENVYPAEIEATLISHQAVLESGVTSMSHEIWGQVPIAFVVLNHDTNCTEEDLLQYCSERLAKYKLPKAIHVVKQLPRNASNKLLRRELLQLLPS